MQRFRARQGITLLEVLFSIFVLAVGILSIASLIPAAKFLVRDAVHSDSATALGMAAVNDIRARGYLASCAAEPWTDTDADGTADAGEFTDTNGNGVYDAWPYGVVIDGMALAHPSNTAAANPDVAALASFPYTSPIGGTAQYGASPFQRTTPIPYAALTSGALGAENLAARLFGTQDAIPFAVPEDAALRPFRQYRPGDDNGWGNAGVDDDGDGTTDEPDEAGWLNSDDVSTLSPDYTWLASVMPGVPVDDPTTAAVEGTPEAYRVSVAVFYKRDTLLPLAGSEPDVPAERMMYLDLIGSGIGGGDCRLRASSATAADQLKVRGGDWLAVIGWRAGGAGTPSVGIPGGVNGMNIPFLFWYRVLGAADIEPAYNLGGTDYLAREITLAGPDLTYRMPDGTMITGSAVDDDDDALTDPVAYDADADAATGPTFQVAVFRDCIGVFERTIRND